MMPRDVRTRWNSTHNMLEFALQYRKVLDVFCGDRSNGVRDYEMSRTEWEIAEQLCDVLKVRRNYFLQSRVTF